MKYIIKALGDNAKFYPNYLTNYVASDFKFHLDNGIKRIVDDNDRMVEEIAELKGDRLELIKMLRMTINYHSGVIVPEGKTVKEMSADLLSKLN